MNGPVQYPPDMIAVDGLGRLGGYPFLIAEDASMGTADMGDEDRYDQRFQFITA